MARDPAERWTTGSGSDSGSSTAHGHRLSETRSNSSSRRSISPHSRISDHLASSKSKEETIGAEILVKMEPGKAPKLARTSSQKVLARTPPSFLDEPNKYDEATSSFQVIPDCIYSNKYIGSTDPALECDCAEEWDQSAGINGACGEDSDCINRATKMECIDDDCSCGDACQNQRFQRKEYAPVTVFKTEKKGYGLRADADLRPNDFIFEYLGEVINEPNFHRRMRQYDDEGIKHFYFMSLNKGEFIDATKKGNLGRFCNHSCNPNCYVDKWVVGDKLRMGIFAERYVKAGEELVFNYNVDRYGADPQPCYCGEPNCTGFIGGRTQTERATKLSNATIEALGIDDYNDWEYAVAKKPKKPRKTGENDEEYVNDVQPRSLEEDGVTKVMAALMQCKEKWIAVKLLGRIQRATDDGVMNRVVRMHGYRILKTALTNFLDDANVTLQVLDILFKLPRITRNKIMDSGIEEVVEKLRDNEDEVVAKQSSEILVIWSKLEVAYRIPRVKRDPSAFVRADRPERKDPRPRSKSPVAPKGPRSMVPQRIAPSFNSPRQPYRKLFKDLPAGWFSATSNGKLYFYTAAGNRQWIRPTEPAIKVAPPAPKVDSLSHEQKLQQIINSITKNNTPKEKSPAVSTPQTAQGDVKEEKPKKEWQSFPEEKQKRLYENTLFPHIKRILDKYRSKLPREDLKRFGKEVSKKLVNSDFKNGRVEDPNRVSAKGERAVKKYVKEFFDKAVVKHREHEKKKRDKAAGHATSAAADAPPSSTATPADADSIMADAGADEPAHLSDAASSVGSDAGASPSGSERKRKRDSARDDDDEEEDERDMRGRSPAVRAGSVGPKRVKMLDGGDEVSTPQDPPTPPPPPPPPSPPEITDSPGGVYEEVVRVDSCTVGALEGMDSMDGLVEGCGGLANHAPVVTVVKAVNGGAG